LERLDFIRARTLQPDLEYIFKHALTQEVVYNGLLKKDRQALHERIGQVIEKLFYDRLPEFYEILAYHYTQGQSILKAVDYLMKSGDKSFKRSALDESHSYFKEAFDLLSDKPDKTKGDDELLIDLIIKWGYAYYYRADYMGLLSLLKTHESLVESHANKQQLAMFYGWLGLANSRREMLADGYGYMRKALQIAEEIGDMKAIGYNCAWLVYTSADMGLLDEAIIFGEKAREAAKHFESDQDLFRTVLFNSAYVHWFKGDVVKIAAYGQALLNYGRRYSDLRSIAFHYCVMGMSRYPAGDFPSAIEYFKKVIQVSPDPVLSHGARMLLGMSYLNTGQLKEAQSAFEEVIEYSEKYGYEFTGAPAQAFKGMILIVQGDLKQGMNFYENANRLFFERKSLHRYAYGNQLMGKVYSKIAQGGGEKKDFAFLVKNIGFLIKTLPFAQKKAEEHLNIAIKTAGEIGYKSVLGQAYLELGKLHKAKGKTEKARQSLSKAIDAFEKCEADVFLKQARETLAALG
jgi:tetratricopeptide (TPR) repeat protein